MEKEAEDYPVLLSLSISISLSILSFDYLIHEQEDHPQNNFTIDDSMEMADYMMSQHQHNLSFADVMNFAMNQNRISGEEFHENVSSAKEQRSENSAVKNKRKRPRSTKTTEEVEIQRMTHIAVERNRRKQMNEHLRVLRALMPNSYVQRVRLLGFLLLLLLLLNYIYLAYFKIFSSSFTPRESFLSTFHRHNHQPSSSPPSP